MNTLLAAPSSIVSSVQAISRRELPSQGSTLKVILEKDCSKWASLIPPQTTMYISALGTTRGAAGSFANQRKIDYDLNLELAKAAKAAGASTFVLISLAGATSSSMVPYTKMKGELEDAVSALGFDHTVIIKPGLIVGNRGESRPTEWVLHKIANGFGAISPALKDMWAQDADVIAKAAVNAGLQSLEGKREKGVWMIDQSEIVRLGRQEWKEFSKE